MRWHTEECMRYAAETGKPWCIIDCADTWRAFEKEIRLRKKSGYPLTISSARMVGALLWVMDVLGMEVNTDERS